MRLLHIKTFEFSDFYDDAIPPYAILSHRWREDEVSYQDFLARRKQGGAGWRKIMKACRLVATDGQRYGSPSWIWIDTCCINKESSAELSEAINSMWRWYRDAVVCYAYLDDVPNKPRTRGTKGQYFWETEAFNAFEIEFSKSQWFTRGWTLQELLAPLHVEFLSESWTSIGTKDEFCQAIDAATGISKYVIQDKSADRLKDKCAAEKMSWAANRRTSRVEDMAYCLLGLMGVNMSLLYGEGKNAFVRLQEEILRSSDDESIFSWSSHEKQDDAFGLSPCGYIRVKNDELCYAHLFADSPSRFASCGEVGKAFDFRPKPFQLTTRGLRMDTILLPMPGYQGEFLAPINCHHWGNRTYPLKYPLALQLVLTNNAKQIFTRKGCVNLYRPEFSGIKYSRKWDRFLRAIATKSALPDDFKFYPRISPWAMISSLILLAVTYLWLRTAWFWCTCAAVFALWLNWIKSEQQTIFISTDPTITDLRNPWDSKLD